MKIKQYMILSQIAERWEVTEDEAIELMIKCKLLDENGEPFEGDDFVIELPTVSLN